MVSCNPRPRVHAHERKPAAQGAARSSSAGSRDAGGGSAFAEPPFSERIATFATRIEHGVVYVNPKALAPGTFVSPSHIDPASK
jgi:hypothetical protein